MFIAMYTFKVKQGQEAEFEKSWHDLTLLIYSHESSLGSRLHKKSKGNYLAYAQWPNKNAWKNSGKKLPENAKIFQENMKAACESIETIYELDVVFDLLVNKNAK